MSSSLFAHVSRQLESARLSWTGGTDDSSVGWVSEDDYLRRLGATIKAVRKALKLTQPKLAERVGLDFNTISRWEGGKTSLSAYNLTLLWNALTAVDDPEGRVPAEWLLHPTDSISELRERVSRIGRAAQEAGRLDAEAELAHKAGARESARLGTR